MDKNFYDLVQDVIQVDELADVKGGLMNPPKDGCVSKVCEDNLQYGANYCNTAVCMTQM